MSESVALANVTEVGGKLSSSICHKPPNTQASWKVGVLVVVQWVVAADSVESSSKQSKCRPSRRELVHGHRTGIPGDSRWYLEALCRGVENSLWHVKHHYFYDPSSTQRWVGMGKVRSHKDSENPMLASDDGFFCHVKLRVPTKDQKHHIVHHNSCAQTLC